MQKGRQWQFDYGYEYGKTPNNWLAPCSIRDHYTTHLQRLQESDGVKPEDENAAVALRDSKYEHQMIEYDKIYQEMTEKIWQEFLARSKVDVSV